LEEGIEVIDLGPGDTGIKAFPQQRPEDILWLADNIEKIVTAHNKIRTALLHFTKSGDWVIFSKDGKEPTAELGAAGCFRISSTFGISFLNGKVALLRGRDNIGEWIRYEAEYDCTFRGAVVRTFGRCGSRTPFFGKKGGEWRDPSELDMGNMKIAAIRGAMKEGVKVLLGLHHFPIEDLRAAGVRFHSEKGHDFKSGEPQTPGAEAPAKSNGTGKGAGDKPISEPQRKRMYAILMKGCSGDEEKSMRDSAMKDWLKSNLNVEHSKDIQWPDYENACKYAETIAGGGS